MRNVTRVKMAKETVQWSGGKLDDLYLELANHTGTGFEKLSQKLKEHKETHQYHYRELVKAEDALGKLLATRKSQLRELLDKSKDLNAENA